MKSRILLVALAAFSAGAELQGAVIHVSGDAPEGGDGSEARPFNMNMKRCSILLTIREMQIKKQ